MIDQSIGFIGGGRVTRILLSGWKWAGAVPAQIVVSDPSAETLAKLQAEFPSIVIAPGDNRRAGAQSVVFLAVHPPAMMPLLAELSGAVAADTLVVSLAPKFTLAKLAAALGGHARLARVIPNAPSVMGAGYNPFALASGLSEASKARLTSLLAPLGDCPEVAEAKLEAFAMLTAMGPTYFWFQLEALRELGRGFGLTDADLEPALKRMICGAARTLLSSGLAPAQVMDLVPVKPLAEDEGAIRQAYQTRLPALFAKIKP
jgi:pyrroline-5-carboxylate reductase